MKPNDHAKDILKPALMYGLANPLLGYARTYDGPNAKEILAHTKTIEKLLFAVLNSILQKQ